MPTLITGIGGVKLHGVPTYPKKSTERAGSLIANATVSLLDEWNWIPIDCPRGMVFDTTSSNTGSKTAGCVAIQEALEHHLLWFACRHHMGEVVLKHVWDAFKIEVAKPEITVFERFKDNFSKITHSDIAGLDYPSINWD